MTDKVAKQMADSPGNPERKGDHPTEDATLQAAASAAPAGGAGSARAAGGASTAGRGAGAATAAGAGGIDVSQVFDRAYEDKSLAELLDAPVSALQGLSDADAEKLRGAFNIKTVRDLATNKFFLRARGLYLLAGER